MTRVMTVGHHAIGQPQYVFEVERLVMTVGKHAMGQPQYIFESILNIIVLGQIVQS